MRREVERRAQLKVALMVPKADQLPKDLLHVRTKRGKDREDKNRRHHHRHKHAPDRRQPPDRVLAALGLDRAEHQRRVDAESPDRPDQQDQTCGQPVSIVGKRSD